jgi:NADPH-dependent 2,4-dienoyl-CoA reductase/sulfur reductase-like enzyme
MEDLSVHPVAGMGTLDRERGDLVSKALRYVDVALGETGHQNSNDRMQTAIEGLWAAGNCAEAFHLVWRRLVNIALGITANKHGRIGGINLAGGRAMLPGVVSMAVSKTCA